MPADEPWARHIWDRDPRFKEYLTKGGGTVHGIATGGSIDDQRFLWGNLEAFRQAVNTQAALSLPDAIAEYVEAISGQHGIRLDALLARTGLGGQDPITNQDMARRLGVTEQRASQIVQRLWYHRDRC